MRLFNLFKTHKGVIASILGYLIAFSVDGPAIYDFWHGIEQTYEQLQIIILWNITAIIWVILPSRISISRDGLEIED